MARCIFGFPTYTDPGALFTPVPSGGSFVSALPVTNVQDRRLIRVARTTDALTTSTTLDFDLQRGCPLGLVSALIPNLTKSSVPTIQWKLANVADFSVVLYDSTALQAWPTGVTADDVTGADGSPLNVYLTKVLPSIITARYLRLAIVDTANADGHVDFARVLGTGAFTPSLNFQVGSQTGFENDTQRVVTDGGSALYNAKAARRIDTLQFTELQSSEAMATIRDMQYRLGTSGQLLWVPDPGDASFGWKRTFLGVFKELNPLDISFVNFMNTQYVIVEDL